jgi:hypothetical protein
VRRDYVSAVVESRKTGYQSFDEINSQGDLRRTLSDMGAARPTKFWGGSRRGTGGNLQFGGCYGLQNPVTNQVVYHAVVHCSGCWPVFLKGFYMDRNNSSSFSLSGWLEGRGSAAATQSGQADTIGLNKSLLSSGVRPMPVCSSKDCDQENGGNQDEILPNALGGGNAICKTFAPQGDSRPEPNQVAVAHKKEVFSIDQWAKARGGLCQRCKSCNTSHQATKTSEKYCEGNDPKPSGIVRIANCGDIDPLIWVGLRYACVGNDAFGRIIKTGENATSEDFIGRCDHYFFLKPACNNSAAPMDKPVGDLTNMDGKQGPCIIRRKKVPTSYSALTCRVDSAEVKPWYGPYKDGPANAVEEQKQAATEFCLQDLQMGQGTNLSNGEAVDKISSLTKSKLCTPLDQLIPYHAVCDICNPGSPMCGMYGTCRNESNLWEGKVVLRSQAWTNTSFYTLNPIYSELECKYKRDCQERHCCADAPDIEGYCKARQIEGGSTRTGKKCNAGVNMWTYYGVPNKSPSAWTPNTLPMLGGYPHCSSGAVQAMKNTVGECCAPQVQTAVLPCGPELAKRVQLMPPGCPKPACGTRPCTGNPKSKYCPAKLPKLSGTSLSSKGGADSYPIGGENVCGMGGNPGTSGPVPANSPPPDSPPPQVPKQDCTTETKSSASGDSTTTTTCQTCVNCYTTPLVISFSRKEPEFGSKKVCFALDPTRPNLSYHWLKSGSEIGFLAMDLNKNGLIDSGHELFGTLTGNRYRPDGYTALAETKDKNKDGLIDGSELGGILVWQDSNEDGISQKSEIKNIEDYGVIELDAGRYQTKRKKKTFSPKDLIYANSYSPQGYKVQGNDGTIINGPTWDITFKGEADERCSAVSSKLNNLTTYLQSLIGWWQ